MKDMAQNNLSSNLALLNRLSGIDLYQICLGSKTNVLDHDLGHCTAEATAKTLA